MTTFSFLTIQCDKIPLIFKILVVVDFFSLSFLGLVAKIKVYHDFKYISDNTDFIYNHKFTNTPSFFLQKQVESLYRKHLQWDKLFVFLH